MALDVSNHLASLRRKHDEALATLNTLDGAMQECDNTLKLIEFQERGSQVEGY